MAWTERYVTVAGAGANDGTSEANAFTFAQMVTDINTGSPAGKRYNIQSGTNYDLSGGAVTLSGTGPWILQGYATTVGDAIDTPSNRAVLHNGTATTDMLTVSGARSILRDLICVSTASSGTGDGIRYTTQHGAVERVTVYGWYNNGIECTNGPLLLAECEAYECNKANTAGKGGFWIGGGYGVMARHCISHNHTGSNADGFQLGGNSVISITLDRCVADTCGGVGFDFYPFSGMAIYHFCDAYNNTGDGFRIATAGAEQWYYAFNCNAVGNAYGFSTASSTKAMLYKCGSYNNSSGRLDETGDIQDIDAVTYTGDPYTDAANGDFTLNNTAGAGAAGRNAARAKWLQTSGYTGSTTAYLDIGASRHQDPASGGGGRRTHARIHGV